MVMHVFGFSIVRWLVIWCSGNTFESTCRISLKFGPIVKIPCRCVNRDVVVSVVLVLT